MNITIQANDFPIYTINANAEFEPLFLKPDGKRTRFPIGWKGLGRYTAGTLRLWHNGTSLIPGTDFTETDGGVFFNITNAPLATASFKEYMVSYVPRPEDKAISTGITYPGEEYFLFPNWMELGGISEAFWVAKYHAARNTATSAAAGTGTTPVSKKGVIPWASITFPDAISCCLAKGNGFHVIRNREWGNIAMWCRSMGLYPSGNSNSGVDGMGISATPDPTQSGRTLTGTGPISWNHNLQDGGISDLVGNIWDMVDGVQLNSGVLYVNDSSNNLMNTGISPAFGTTGSPFSLLRTEDALNGECVPAASSGISALGGDGFWFATTGTTVLYRGGGWGYGSLDGLFAFTVNSVASYSAANFGFRLAKTL